MSGIAEMLLEWGVPWWGAALAAAFSCALGAGIATSVVKSGLALLGAVKRARASREVDPGWWDWLWRVFPFLVSMALSPGIWPYGGTWVVGLVGGVGAPAAVWLAKGGTQDIARWLRRLLQRKLSAPDGELPGTLGDRDGAP
jgi:hypothetical protein